MKSKFLYLMAVLALALCLLAGCGLSAAAANAPETSGNVSGGYQTLDELNGKRIGIQMGSNMDEIVLERLPEAELAYFNTMSDMITAVETHKIDGFPGPVALMRIMKAESPRIRLLSEQMETYDVAVVMPKTPAGQQLCGEFNEWLSSAKASGEWEQLISKWLDGPEEEKTVPDYKAFPAPKGVLKMATEGGYAPMEYYRDGKMFGLDVDLAARFCAACGYGLEIVDMSFDSVLPAVQTGKADFAAAGIAVTEERKESILYTDVYYTDGTVMAVLDTEAVVSDSFFQSIVSSFEKTFIRESRWKLFLEGIGTTLLITVLSILCGTVLGFGVYMLCRNGNRFANAVTHFCVWLIQGLPVVVLLMVLYYIVFSKSAVSGSVVAVIAFTLVFGAAVYGMLRSGVGAVPRGQTEAAYALGYGNAQTFFRIILPQAVPHFLPSYKGEITSLIKATAVVGYIAVQDLTKMGDIVRGRTYEAFFPLIAVAVIYFILAAVLTFIVNRLEFTVNPRRRKKSEILSGVRIPD